MKAIKTKSMRDELERLHAASKSGLLTAEAVVSAARDETSPLHSAFEWDDSQAAHQYRLHQARVLIVSFKVTISGLENHIVPVRLSLLQDRSEPGGGYRMTEDVLKDEVLREEMMRMAVSEIRAWMRRYAMFQDLVAAVGGAVTPFEQPSVAQKKARLG